MSNCMLLWSPVPCVVPLPADRYIWSLNATTSVSDRAYIIPYSISDTNNTLFEYDTSPVCELAIYIQLQ